MTGERQFATDLDGGRGTACSSGCLSYERPGVSQNCLSAASCPDKTNFCWGLLNARGHGSYERLVPFLCQRWGRKRFIVQSHLRLFGGWSRKSRFVSTAEVCSSSAEHPAVSRTSLDRNYQLNPESSVSAQSSPSRSEVKKPRLFTF